MGSENLSCNMVSPCPGSVGCSSFAEAKKRLKKLERDYQHTYEKYEELQYRYRTKLQSSEHHSRWAIYCIYSGKNVVEQLQDVLDKLKEAPQRGRETPSNTKQFFLMHGCKSLAQEKMILQLKAENKEVYKDGLSQETIDIKRINEEFSYIQRIIPVSSSKKPTRDLLRRVNEIKKLTANGALVRNLTSQKLLKKVIRNFEKEGREQENILQDERRIEKGYTEKMRVLQGKCECISEKRDAEKKYILELKKNFRSRHKTASQRKDCRKG